MEKWEIKIILNIEQALNLMRAAENQIKCDTGALEYWRDYSSNKHKADKIHECETHIKTLKEINELVRAQGVIYEKRKKLTKFYKSFCF